MATETIKERIARALRETEPSYITREERITRLASEAALILCDGHLADIPTEALRAELARREGAE